MSDEQVPAALLGAVRRDLRPVRPFPPPARRALALLPVALFLLAGIPASWGWRANLAELSVPMAWGLSALQAAAGLLVVGAALREAVPGRELSRSAVAATFAGAAALFVGVTLATERVLPAAEPPEVWARFVWECFGMAISSSLPALVLAAWLVARALPTRPAVAGALCGLGAGIMADAGVRLFCWVSSPAHVLAAHGGAILGVALAGAAGATIVDEIRACRRTR